MVTRLSTADAAFYQQENTATPIYVGSLSILRRPRGGLSYETLLETVERRLPQIPRYRQKVREVTLGLARPVWSTTPTSTSPITCDAPRCPPRAATPNSTNWFPGWPAGRWTAPGRCGRCISSRAWPTIGWRCSSSRIRPSSTV